ncbi:UNVERIFIED_CONTAM: Serine/threonine receptor-like kinase NFP [Sesamum angustifolium]|uniref:Serine/threonine receptor-like kinase NFP n=2 Tax=Sesamum TaxID=4181 RepID=A0AAW2P290_9LAMI
MRTKSIYLFPLLCLFFFCNNVQAQPSTIGYNCTATNQTSNSCQTYVFYRSAAPDYLDLASIGDLFSVSRLMISNPSNISSPSSPLLLINPLLPIKCSCTTVNSSITISYAALNYTIKGGDTFYRVSILNFQNLTTYQSVEVVNPTFEPTRLNIGDVIVFPIFCKCPDPSQLRNQVNYLISYVFQPSDNITDVASRLGSTEAAITAVNGGGIQPFDTVFVPVSRLPNLTQPVVPPAAPETTTDRKGAVIGEGLMKGRERDGEKQQQQQQQQVKIGNGMMKGEQVNLMADVSDCLDKYRVFGMEELRGATEGFDEKWIIQGSVYKGCIDGEWLFVGDKFIRNSFNQFINKLMVNHGNLVRLEGFCIDPEEANCYLVYEYVENGSLSSWLHEARPEKLSWKTRLRIAIDVANGLQYIHEHTRPKVVHKDIKSSNILLDSNMRAKIANFGLARSGCNAITMHIVGTQGYIAPEYLADGVVSTKMDVFSFGVVLLELVTGREAIDERGNVLWASVDRVLVDRKQLTKLREWMDESLLKESCTMESVSSVVSVALACLNRDPARRPSMVEIVYALSKSDDLFFDVSEDGFSPRQVVAR